MPKVYSEQFKADAVTDARLQAHGMSPSNDPVVAKEMSAVLKRIRELEMENEVLRAAAAYLSQETIQPKGSSRPWKHRSQRVKQP